MLELRSIPPHPLVAASILSADFGRIAEECRDVLARGADILHVDVMDGHFVPNLTMGADMVKGLRRHFPDTYLDVHLMVERPDLFLDMFAQAGADNFSFHLEVSQPARRDGVSPRQLIQRIHSLGMDAGMVINPPTAPDGLEPFLPDLDMVLMMSVNPGRSGQKFLGDVLAKATWLKQRIGPATRLEIDGGINLDTAPLAAAAGCDVLVTASALFGAGDRTAVIRGLHAAR